MLHDPEHSEPVDFCENSVASDADGRPLRMYLALEGGGAKGVAHVGAIAAFEEAGYRFCGVSGTSAGAAVAALVAAGYTAEEIVSQRTNASILDHLPDCDKVVDVLKASEWNKIRLLRDTAQRKSYLRPRFALGFLSILAVYFGSAQIMASVPFGYGIVIAFVLLGAALLGVYHGCKVLGQGIADLTKFRDSIGILLDKKINNGHAPHGVRFEDFGHSGRPSLKIIATNVSKGTLEIFSPETTPLIKVADAVAASVCIPVLFCRWPVKPKSGNPDCIDYYLDGGLLSNLPAWVFDEEKSVDRDAITAVIHTSERTEDMAPKNAFEWFVRVTRTIIFGTAPLDKRNIGRFYDINLDAKIGLLDFDRDGEDFRGVVEQSYAATKAYLNAQHALDAAAESVRQAVRQILEQACEYFGFPNYDGRVRCAIGVPRRSSIELRYHSGYMDTPDEWLTLPKVAPFLDESLGSERSAFIDLTSAQLSDFLPDDEHRWVRKIIAPDLSWVLSVPIVWRSAHVERVPSEFVVLVDGDKLLPFTAEPLEQVLAELEADIKSVFAGIRE